MTGESAIAKEYALGPTGMAKDTGRRSYPTHDEIAQLAYTLYESRGRQDGAPHRRLAVRRTGTRAALCVTAEYRQKQTTH